jgi:hypothetical protein
MTIKTKQYPIVGMVYRHPADILVTVMPVGTKLFLVPEPFNQFDHNAIAVWVDLDSNLMTDHVLSALAKAKNTDWVNQKSLQLGYLPKQVAAYIKSKGGLQGGAEGVFWYTFGNNVPHIKFDFDEQDT